MAKKEQQINSVILSEIIGIIMILIGLFLLIEIGIFSKYINAFIKILIGYVSYVVNIFLIVLGVRIMLGKSLKVLNTVHKVAIILLFVSVLLLFGVFASDGSKEMYSSFKAIVSSFGEYAKNEDVSYAGGLLGNLCAMVFVTLLSSVGATIVSIVGLVVSLMLIFQKSLVGVTSKTASQVKEASRKIRIKNSGKKIFDYEEDGDTEEEVDETYEEDEIYEEESDYVSMLIDGKDEAISLDQHDTEEMVVDTGRRIKSKKRGRYVLPPLDLLSNPLASNFSMSKEELDRRGNLLIATLKDFGVSAKVEEINVGPTVTQYEISIQAGTKLSKLRNLSGELALALAAKDVRIQAPIPLKSTVGIELPNENSQLITLKEIITAIPKSEDNKTVFCLGKDIMGKPIYSALNKMPHLLVAGATGSGKSVCINSIIISIAMRAKPTELKLLMIDPKKVELSGYNGLPHLLAPVVTDPRKAALALQKIVAEMEKRYDLFSDSNSKNIESYNEKMREQNLHMSVLPYVVVIVDELADLMMVASKEVEDAIMRITQMARAAGIHLIVATQRPSTDVITGIIKANIPSRIAFAVSSSIDSRTILDATGAEKLLGRGDMLFVPMGTNHPIRIQGAFLSEKEVENVVDYCANQQIAQFDENLINLEEKQSENGNGESEDDMYAEVLEFVLENQKASTSLLQRRFRIGYNRASRLIDDLESNGIIGPANGSKPRDVIIGNE